MGIVCSENNKMMNMKVKFCLPLLLSSRKLRKRELNSGKERDYNRKK